MRKLFILSWLYLFVLSNQECQAQEKEVNTTYSYKREDPNGIGKWYMGREIAHVMGFQGIRWLERPEREKEENTAVLLKNMEILPTDIIADIGAGSGYHAFKMAKTATEGHIYAVDIQDEMLEAIEKKNESSGLTNITTIKGNSKSVNLPEKAVDKVLMVDVYHEFDFPSEMIVSIKKALRQDGKVYLIEYRSEDASVPIKEIHKMSEKQAIKEMKAAGFFLKENINNLPWQHCMVFTLHE